MEIVRFSPITRTVAEPDALEREGRHRDLPPLMQLADEVRFRNSHLVEEHLVELGITGHLHQRPYVDPGIGRHDTPICGSRPR